MIGLSRSHIYLFAIRSSFEMRNEDGTAGFVSVDCVARELGVSGGL